jgi:hypothetical protein
MKVNAFMGFFVERTNLQNWARQFSNALSRFEDRGGFCGQIRA